MFFFDKMLRLQIGLKRSKMQRQTIYSHYNDPLRDQSCDHAVVLTQTSDQSSGQESYSHVISCSGCVVDLQPITNTHK